MDARKRRADEGTRPAASTRHSVLSPGSRRRVRQRQRSAAHRTRKDMEVLAQATRLDRQAELSVHASAELEAIQRIIWSSEHLQNICRTSVCEGLYDAGVLSGDITPPPPDPGDGGVKFAVKELLVGAATVDAHLHRMHEECIRMADAKEKAEVAGWRADQLYGGCGRRWSIATMRMSLAGEMAALLHRCGRR